MSSEAVVIASLRDLARGRTVCIPGFKNHILTALIRNDVVTPFVRAVVKQVKKQINHKGTKKAHTGNGR